MAQALSEAVAVEKRRLVGWVVACGAAMVLVVAFEGDFLVGVAAMGVYLAALNVRRLVGASTALRDINRADTRPRRGYVVMSSNPVPHAFRPLLGVWSEPPMQPDGRVARPDAVYLCDDEHDDLMSSSAHIVHEAWVDTGPYDWSKPRWIGADAGVAIPHRRCSPLMGWLYLSSLNHAQFDAPRPLTIGSGSGGDTPTTSPWSLPKVASAVAGRFSILVAVGVFLHLFT